MNIDLHFEHLKEYDSELTNKFRLPYELVFKSAKNGTIVDADGKEYLDFTSNHDKNSLGYSNDLFINVLKSMAPSADFLSAGFVSDYAMEFSETLMKLFHKDKVYFSSSACEANDTAMKIIRTIIKHRENIKTKNEVIILKSDQPTPNFFIYELLDDHKVLEDEHYAGMKYKTRSIATSNAFTNMVSRNTAAVILDPMSLLNGDFVLNQDFIELANKYTKEYDAILVFDLTTCAPLRTGELLPCEASMPDIITFSEGFQQGLPFGMTLATGAYTRILDDFYNHNYGVSSMALKIAADYLDLVSSDQLKATINESASYMLSKLNELQGKYLNFVDINSKGLYFIIEMDFSLHEFQEKCMDKGILFNCLNAQFIRLCPYFYVTKQEIDHFCATFDAVLGEMKPECRLN